MKHTIIKVILFFAIFSPNAFASNYARISDLVFTSDNPSEITPENAYSFEVLEIDGKEVKREVAKGLTSSPPYVLIEDGNHKIKIEKKGQMSSHQKKEVFELHVTVEAGMKYSILNTENGPMLVLLKNNNETDGQ